MNSSQVIRRKDDGKGIYNFTIADYERLYTLEIHAKGGNLGNGYSILLFYD